RIHQLVRPTVALQADLTVGGDEEAWRSLLSGALETIGMELGRIERIETFWFLRKPPGLRLRVHSSTSSVRTALGEMLEQCRIDKLISSWSWGCYEPELYLFGGSAGIALAHRFFAADTFAVLGYHRLRRQQLIELAPTEFSLWATAALWTQVVAD